MNRHSIARLLRDSGEISSASPLGAIALLLLAQWRSADAAGLLYICDSERRAERLAAILFAMAPDCGVMVLPRWDVLPYDDVPPSLDITGRRASVLRRLAAGLRGPLVLSTPDALLQRVPPRDIWREAHLQVAVGQRLSPAALRNFLTRTGYQLTARVDEPGEASLQGTVVDIYPAGGLGPVRFEYEGDRVAALSSYNAETQRTTGALAEVVLDAASEVIFRRLPRDMDPRQSNPSLARHYGALATVFDYLPRAAIIMDAGAAARAASWLQQVQDSHQARHAVALGRRGQHRSDSPRRLFLDAKSWADELARRKPITLMNSAPAPELHVPRFSTSENPRQALRSFIDGQRRQNRRVLLMAADERELRMLGRRLEEASRRVETLQAGLEAPPGSLLSLRADTDRGFVLPCLALAVVSAADVLGSRASHEAGLAFRDTRVSADTEALRFGDLVIHWQRGVGVLAGLERVSRQEAADQDMIHLQYAGGATLLVPTEELSLIWRHGAAARRGSLDRVDGSTWAKRRAQLVADIAAVAQHLVMTTRQREAAPAPKLVPPPAEYERFVARFRFFPSPDQAAAVEDILADLASERPMDRLVCGDVGFGKTEVALRAAAAAVLCGKQVAVAVPTTVLARQHLETFQQRFASFGISVAQLSRLTPPAEARAIKQRLADGSLSLVIGTHAIAAKDVRFRDLGLLVIDEEQRFGVEQKARLRALAARVHTLTMTATPIPRTLRLIKIGLRDLSVIATPPVRRLPIRTVVRPFDIALASAALRYEKRRGGQSFVVCPRVEDIPTRQQQLAQAAPELDIRVAHGQLPPEAVDDTMVRFAKGEGDVLLATSIIETGLDLPRANTILICAPERFGIAQLHQLRGRVGRGSRRGFAYLLTDGPVAEEAAAARLRAIEQHSTLGSGFAISEQDIVSRGAGEVLGARQAGHMKLVGPQLYRDMLERALRAARGEAVADEDLPQIHLGLAAAIPRAYVPDAQPRLELYERLARAQSEQDLDDLGDEIADRFGPIPEKLQNLIESARIRQICRRLRIAQLDAGPRAVAVTFRPGVRPSPAALKPEDHLRWHGARLVYDKASSTDDRVATAAELLAKLERPGSAG